MDLVTLIIVVVVSVDPERIERIACTKLQPSCRRKREVHKSFYALIEGPEYVKHKICGRQRVFSDHQRVGPVPKIGRPVGYVRNGDTPVDAVALIQVCGLSPEVVYLAVQ